MTKEALETACAIFILVTAFAPFAAVAVQRIMTIFDLGADRYAPD